MNIKVDKEWERLEIPLEWIERSMGKEFFAVAIKNVKY